MKKLDALRAELQSETSELNRLEADRAKVLSDLEALGADRGATLRALATGDESQHAIIAGIDQRIAPLELRAEGFAGLIDDLKKEIEVLTIKVNQAEEEQRVAVEEFLRKKEHEYEEGKKATLKQRMDDILKSYVELCAKLGEFQLDTFRSQEASDLFSGLNGLVSKAVDSSGLVKLDGHGYFGAPVQLTRLISAPSTLQGVLLNPLEVMGAQKRQRQVKYLEEYQAQQ